MTSAGRKYILALQVSKYGLLVALWHEETGRQLSAWYTREQILPSDIAQTEQIVTEVNDRRLRGKST